MRVCERPGSQSTVRYLTNTGTT